MPRSVVGLLAAVGAIMSVLAGLIHGHLEPLITVGAGMASGLAASLALPNKKNTFRRDRHGRWRLSNAEEMTELPAPTQSDGFCQAASVCF
jgi:hypothetical protein